MVDEMDTSFDEPAWTPEMWNNKGTALFMLGRKDEAIRCYDRALEINPQNDNAWANKGVVLYNLGRKDEAIQCYDRALEINLSYHNAWNNGETWNNRGNALNHLKYKRQIQW